MESNVVEVPKPEMTDYERYQFATEVAFNALLSQAKKMGLRLLPVMGLMYLPSQEDTRKFQEACKAILDSLKQEG